MDAGFFNGPIPLSPVTPSAYHPPLALLASPYLNSCLDRDIISHEALAHLSEKEGVQLQEFACNFTGNVFIESLLLAKLWPLSAWCEVSPTMWCSLESSLQNTELDKESLGLQSLPALLNGYVGIRSFYEDWHRLFYCPLSGKLLTHAYGSATGEVVDGDAAFQSSRDLYQASYPYFALMQVIQKHQQSIQEKHLTQELYSDLQVLLNCPIGLSSMHAPRLMNDGVVYEGRSIEQLLVSPMSRMPLKEGMPMHWLHQLRHWLASARKSLDEIEGPEMPHVTI